MDLSLPEGMLDLSQPVPGLSPLGVPGGLPGVGARFLTRQNPVPGQAAPIFRADRQWLSRQMMERSLAPTRFFDEGPYDILGEIDKANEYDARLRRQEAREAARAAAPDPPEGPPIVAPTPPPAAAPAAPPPAPAGMAPGMDEAAFNRQMGLRFGGMPSASTRLFFE